MKAAVILSSLICVLIADVAAAADLVRVVRMKLSAGDLATGIALVEDYRRASGVDEEYLNAVGWLARGALMLDRPDLAASYVAELRKEIPQEKPELVVPYGAAIEVESQLVSAREGRGPALRYLSGELERAKDTALRSRIRKNMNLLSLEGETAPPIAMSETLGAPPAPYAGKPTLLFLWAHWCGDCKAQYDVLARIWQKYRSEGLVFIAPTRTYGTVAEKPVTPEEEKAQIATVWSETYPGLSGVTVPIDTETMVRYGASATPTFVLIDRRGIVQLYAPTRLSEAELSRRIEAVLAAP